MLNRLCTANDRGIKDLLVLDFAGDFIRFPDQAVDGGTVGAFWLLTKFSKDIIEAHNLVFCLSKMVSKPCRKIPVGRLFDHLRQGFHDLIFSVVDVLKRMEE